jgi:hypothetical protein
MAGEVRRAVIDYMNRRKRFAFIPATNVARDMGLMDPKAKKLVKQDLDMLANEGGVKKRVKYTKKNFPLEMYARMVSKIPEDAGVPTPLKSSD